MALQGPIGKEVLDITFRLRSKTQLFDGTGSPFQNSDCSTVASATCGLVFSSSSKPELNVVCLRDLEKENATELTPPSRKLPLPAPAKHIAVNCDSSILAVAVKINGIPHLQFYSVQSFLTPNIQKIREIRLSTDNSDAIHLCWNPVIGPMLAVCTESGQLNMYTLKDTGVEYHGIDPNFKAKSCSWSPKGKQIVVGFANGKLVQFTPELKPARIIDCVPGIMPGSFDIIALQWLSTFQFAAAFLGHQPDSRPILHIINAPKNVPPQYISYSEVCFSSAETRPSKIYLVHVMQWNMLLVGSANTMDVNFLRITQPGDLPVWIHEFPNDLFPTDLPLTATGDETYPIGFDFDICCTGRMPSGEGALYPVMPMLHVMSTKGVLCSFYVINVSNYVDICSPPRPMDPNTLSLFRVHNDVQKRSNISKTPPNPESGFNSPIGQSTPSIAKIPTKMAFSIPQPVASANNAPPPAFGAANAGLFSLGSGGAPSFGMSQMSQQPTTTVKPFSVSNPPENVTFGQTSGQTLISTAPVKPIVQVQVAPQIPSQPLITVPPTFNPQAAASSRPEGKSTTTTTEDDQIFAKMIKDEMKAFDLELQSVLQKSKSVQLNIGTKEESATMRKKLEELDELKKEAAETVESLRSDVQLNRLGLTEMFSMFFEAKAKLDQGKNEKSIFLQNPVTNQGNKRTVDRLINELSMNEIQLDMATQSICAQWSNYQDELRKKNKNRMHNPCLEELYRTLTKNQEIIYRLTEKVAMLKSKLGIKDSINRTKKLENSNLEKLSDSIISMSLIGQVQNENSKLTFKKLKNLRNLLGSRETTIIKPQRPQRPGLNSEIIQEKKLQAMKTMRKSEKKEHSSVASGQPFKPFQNSPTSTIPLSVQMTSAPPSFIKTVQSVPDMTSKAAQSFGSITEVLKTSGPANPAQFSFASPSTAPPISFAAQKSAEAAKTLLFNSAATPASFSMNSQPPSFGFGTPSFGLKEDPKKVADTVRTPAPVAVTASFSIPLANKVATPPQQQSREMPKLVEKKEETKSEAPPSFTFKLPTTSDKKEESATLSFKTSASAGSLFSSIGAESPKPFSFASAGNSAVKPSVVPAQGNTGSGFSFSIGGSGDDKPSPIIVAKPVTASGDAAKSSNNFSFSVSSTASPSNEAKPNETSDVTKPTVSTSFSFGTALSNAIASAATTSTTPSFSFGSLSVSATTPSTTAPALEKAEPSTFSFASALQTTTITPVASASVPSTLSFGSSNTSSTTLLAPVTSTSEATKVTSTETSNPVDPDLQGHICSPDTKPSTVPPSANIFGNSTSFVTPKSDSSSIFGTGSFNLAFSNGSQSQTTQSSSVLNSQTVGSAASTTTTAIFSNQSPVVPAPSSTTLGQNIATNTATSPSIFNLSLGNDSSKIPTASSGPFSFAKPDQSVFGSATSPNPQQPAAPFAGSTSSAGFGNANSSASTGLFGSAASTVFGTPGSQSPPSNGGLFGSVTTTQSNQSNMFATPTSATSNVFGQQPPQSPGGTVFGQNASVGTGLFSQASFTSPTTAASNVFGGNSFATPPSAGIFGQANQQQPQQQASGSIFGGQSSFGQNATSGGSVFGGSSSFGNATASSTFGSSSVFGGNANGFGSPPGGSIFNQQQATFGGGAVFGGSSMFGKSNVFGQTNASPPANQTNSMFEQLGSQQGGSNLFGAMNSSQSQPQQQQQQPGGFSSGFSGSAFSSWR